MIPRLILEHFRNPRNKRSMPDATVAGTVEGRRAGEALTLYLKLEQGRVRDASFTNTGDRQSDPSCSVLTGLVRGKTVPELQAITVEELAARLESIDNPGAATPAHEVLRAALAALRGEPSPFEHEGRLICHCFHVREGRIRRYVRERGLRSVDQVRSWTRACGGCRSCRPDLEVILEQERDAPGASSGGGGASPARRPSVTSALYDDGDLAELLVSRGLLPNGSVPSAKPGELAKTVRSRKLVPPGALENALSELARHQFRCRGCKEPFISLPRNEERRVACPRCRKLNILPAAADTLAQLGPPGQQPGSGGARPAAPSPPSIPPSGPLAPEEGAPGTPARFGPYRIVNEIARGAMGIVFRACHDDLPTREVALKVLQGSLAQDPELLERFRREGQALAKVDHPNIVRVHEAGEAGGVPFFAMELIEGKTLEDLLDDGPVEPTRAAALMAKVAQATAHLHARGILHRDLKLGNVLVGKDGVPKLSDFGLARLMDRNTRLTLEGDRLGTPLYMAPEQFMSSGTVDARADVFGLGVMLYRLVTNAYPHTARTPVELLQRVLNEPIAWPPTPVLPVPVHAVCEKAMEIEVEGRYATALALAQDLDALARGLPVRARPPSRWKRAAARWRRALVLGGAALVLILALAVGRDRLRRHGEDAARASLDDLAARIDALEATPRTPAALMAATAAIDSALEAARAAIRASSATHLEPLLAERARSFERAALAAARGAVSEMRAKGQVAPDGLGALARGQPPFEPGALDALLALLARLRASGEGAAELAALRDEASLLAGRGGEAQLHLSPELARIAAGELPEASDPRLGGLAADLAALRKAVRSRPTELAAPFVVERVALGELELASGHFESAAAAFELALGRGLRLDDARARALWSALASEPFVAAVLPVTTAAAPLRAHATLGLARARAELLDGTAARAAAEDAALASRGFPFLTAAAELVLARLDRVAGDLARAPADEDAALAALAGVEDRRLEAARDAIAASRRLTALAVMPGGGGEPDGHGGLPPRAEDDERTADLVADALGELGVASTRPADAKRATLERARRAAALALDGSPGSDAALAALALVSATVAEETGEHVAEAAALARRAVDRRRSPDALEALALTASLGHALEEAERDYDEAAGAIASRHLGTFARDHELLGLREQAAAAFALAHDPARSLKQLDAAIETATRDCLHPSLLVGLHGMAGAAAGSIPDAAARERHKELEERARKSAEAATKAFLFVAGRMSELQVSALPFTGMGMDYTRVQEEVQPVLDATLRNGFANGWLLRWDREFVLYATSDFFQRAGELVAACEVNEEVFQQSLGRMPHVPGRNDQEALVALARERLARTVDDRGPYVPDAVDHDLAEAVVITIGTLTDKTIIDPRQGVRAARRYVRRNPTLRAGRYFLARLLYATGDLAEASTELDRAFGLPPPLGFEESTGPAIKHLLRAEIECARGNNDVAHRALEQAIRWGLKLPPWWWNAEDGHEGPLSPMHLTAEEKKALEAR
jgi:serine/threonine protein kinase/NifU-like protein involved in Fe-S cluster formation/bacterioferritin-associated ferredoxin